MNQLAVERHFKHWAQMGYGARGVVYLLVGGLAVLAALGRGGQTTDSQGAMLSLLDEPFGNLILAVLVVGLLGYVSWRFIQATTDPDGHGMSGKGLAIRAGLLGSSFTHAFLAGWAITVLLGVNGGDNEQQSATFLGSQWGPLIMVAIGVVVIVVGLAHIYKGWTARFERYMTIPRAHVAWARPVCRFGLLARGVVWCIVGWFFIDAARSAQSDEIKGMADALASLRETAYGPWLLGIVAAGLFAFGIYSLLEAVYRRIDVPFK